ncbi:MAG: hypothetical protein KDA69_08065 [Planctomycetaceae bacterium]|nr:hypothetical protein [Planctomycetaceae bacterium]MCA9044259.1 hypothetical protein [Planctomycetaceae bacterium]MCB9951879.1 hypothetical protein [Planctomycetaceae bacterium]
MNAHRIRLAGPWEWWDENQWIRISLPGATPQQGSEQLRLRRGFHTPSNLDPDETVSVQFPDTFGEILEVSVDSQPVAASNDREFDLTSRLDDYHQLEFCCIPRETELTPPALLIRQVPASRDTNSK